MVPFAYPAAVRETSVSLRRDAAPSSLAAAADPAASRHCARNAAAGVIARLPIAAVKILAAMIRSWSWRKRVGSRRLVPGPLATHGLDIDERLPQSIG